MKEGEKEFKGKGKGNWIEKGIRIESEKRGWKIKKRINGWIKKGKDPVEDIVKKGMKVTWYIVIKIKKFRV